MLLLEQLIGDTFLNAFGFQDLRLDRSGALCPLRWIKCAGGTIRELIDLRTKTLFDRVAQSDVGLLQADLVGACRAVPIETGARGGEPGAAPADQRPAADRAKKGFSSAASTD